MREAQGDIAIMLFLSSYFRLLFKYVAVCSVGTHIGTKIGRMAKGLYLDKNSKCDGKMIVNGQEVLNKINDLSKEKLVFQSEEKISSLLEKKQIMFLKMI